MAIINEVYGYRGQRKMAVDINRTEATISRWCNGTTPVEQSLATLIRLVLVMHRHGINWQKWLADYMNDVNQLEGVI